MFLTTGPLLIQDVAASVTDVTISILAVGAVVLIALIILTLRDRQAAVKPLCTQTQVYPRNPTFGGCLSMTITFEMKALTFRT